MLITWSTGQVTPENEARGYMVITWRETCTQVLEIAKKDLKTKYFLVAYGNRVSE